MASSSDSKDDDGFRARVDRIFGSLIGGSSSFRQPSSAVRSSPWSLTGEEVERKKWRPDTGSSDRDELPCSASFDGFLNKNRKSSRRNAKLGGDIGGDLDDIDEDGDGRPEDGDEWDIRSSIGLDPTLDNEEEEDEYDKVACGRENADERLYMRDVTNHGKHLNAENVLLDLLSGTTKDPRANHLAARNRLMEDDAESQVLNVAHNPGTEFKVPQVRLSGDGVPLRSILKRKDTNSIPKSRKRVKFDPGCISSSEDLSEGHPDSLNRNSSTSAMVSNNGSMLGKNALRVQDRTQYTHYSLNSTSEVDEESNTEACMDFLKVVRSSKPSELGSNSLDVSVDLPKSITFIPKKKAVDFESVDSCSEVKQDKKGDSIRSSHQAECPIGIAVVEAQQSEVGAVEEAEPEVSATGESCSIQKPIRRYRTKSSSDDSDC